MPEVNPFYTQFHISEPTQVLSRAMSALCPGVYAIRPKDEKKKRGEVFFEISVILAI